MNLGAVGDGLEYWLARYLSLQVAYGWQVSQSGFEDEQNARWHVSPTVRRKQGSGVLLAGSLLGRREFNQSVLKMDFAAVGPVAATVHLSGAACADWCRLHHLEGNSERPSLQLQPGGRAA